MFFRLSKNVVKNVYFDPFGGGYPPSPLNSLYIASAYVFIEKSSIFIKKAFNNFCIFLFPSPSGWGLPKAVTPQARLCLGGQDARGLGGRNGESGFVRFIISVV
jgi:hypothetical protein